MLPFDAGMCSEVRFSPEAIDRLFDSFYSTMGKGKGIGLSVCRSIVEGYRDKYWAPSHCGRVLHPRAYSFRVSGEQARNLD